MNIWTFIAIAISLNSIIFSNDIPKKVGNVELVSIKQVNRDIFTLQNSIVEQQEQRNNKAVCSLKKRLEYAQFYLAFRKNREGALTHYIDEKGLSPYVAIDGRVSIYDAIIIHAKFIPALLQLYDCNSKSVDKQRMLVDTMKYGTTAMVHRLLKHIDEDLVHFDHIDVPLEWFKIGGTRVMEDLCRLLQYGKVNLEYCYPVGNTLLHEALVMKQTPELDIIIKWLLIAGANPYASNNKGYNCFDLASSKATLNALMHRSI